jgi:hypothetical protein
MALGHQPAHPPNRRDQLGDGVLGGHGVVEQGRVQRPLPAVGKQAGGCNDLVDGVLDALGTPALADAGAPVGEDAVVHAGVIQWQARGHLPSDVAAERIGGLAVRQVLEGLQHHCRGHHLARNRRPPSARGEQIGEHLVGEQPAALVGQDGVHRSVGHQLAAQRCGVEQL